MWILWISVMTFYCSGNTCTSGVSREESRWKYEASYADGDECKSAAIRLTVDIPLPREFYDKDSGYVRREAKCRPAGVDPKY